jgi:hypothetical protein
MMSPPVSTDASERQLTPAAATVYLVASSVDRLAEGRRLAAALVSKDRTDDSKAIRGVHPDVIELVPPEGKERIGIAQVRSVIRSAQFAPVEAGHKVCLIPIAEALTLEAANALLKILEEPPRGLAFVLLAEHPSDLLPTIVSRSRLLRIPITSKAEIVANLIESGYAERDAEWISRLAMHDDELHRLSAMPIDVEASLRSTSRLLSDVPTQELVELALGDDPILRRQSMLHLLARLASRDGELLTVGVRILAAQTRETLSRMLHDLQAVAFDLVRSSYLPTSLPDESATQVQHAFGIRRLHDFCLALDEANRSLAVYGPIDGILLSLFLIPEGGGHDI